MKVLEGERKMNGIDGSMVVFFIGCLMAIGGGYAYFSKDTQASVRNAEMTKDILDKVSVAITRTQELDEKVSQATIDFEQKIGETNLALKEASQSSKNISVNLPHSIQFNVVYTPKTKTLSKPVTLPPIPKEVSKVRARARGNN